MERHTQEAFQVVVREREPYITVPLNILVELGFGEGGAAGKGSAAGEGGDQRVSDGPLINLGRVLGEVWRELAHGRTSTVI